ncbi:hypothetical protein KCP76_14525 [Salmonella enterica subsp. enterica serovar Weltevreden]|nr:hypothetical protein KCP76_14525 [Salmonella enterica subsp. enterica serovar Weltevreden]
MGVGLRFASLHLRVRNIQWVTGRWWSLLSKTTLLLLNLNLQRGGGTVLFRVRNMSGGIDRRR